MNRKITTTSSLDRTAKIVTWLVLGAIPPFLLLGYLLEHGMGLTVTAAILFATAIICRTLAVQEYRLNIASLEILRPLRPITIELRDVVEIRLVEAEEMKGTVRLLGVGGLFGWIGRFTNRALGPFYLYTGHREDLTLIRMKAGKKYVIGPDDVNFLPTLIERVKAAKGSGTGP